MMLSIENIAMRFGGLTVLDNISIGVKENAIHGIIGPNGSGKTTLFNVISGIYKPTDGQIVFQGENIAGLAPHKITKRGISRTFQLLRVFPSMTVLENLMLALTVWERTTMLDDLLMTPRARKQEQQMKEKAWEVLELIGLTHKANNAADGISVGQRRMLQLGLAVINSPKLLLLDECVAGLDPENVEKLVGLLQTFRNDMGITILMIEHIMDVVLRVCDTVTALDYGEKIFEGTPTEVVSHPAVIEAYLGKEA